MTYHSPDKDPIIGETIIAVAHDPNEDSLTFHCIGGKYMYSTEGDCCSQSWIEHMTLPPDIVGATITGITSPELPPHEDLPPDGDDDHIAVYHTAWQTTKGEIIAEYRNSSNGYYGGWMTGPTVEER